MQQNTLIRESLYNLSYTESYHLFAIKANDTYYEYTLTSEGDYKQIEIPFLGNNIAIILCLTLSCLLALYCVIAVFLILIRLKWQFERRMQKYLERNRRFAIAKKEIQHKNDENKTKVVTTKAKRRLFKILHISLFTSRIKLKNLVFIEDDGVDDKEKKKHENRISLSFFQTPALYLEHVRRQRSNSFREFLNSIYESAAHFPKWKLASEGSWRSTSIRLDLLQPSYLEFCTKEGLKPRQIEEEIPIIKEFNLKLEYKIDTSTDAYTHIRWKTPLEKLDDIEQKNIAKSEGVKEDEANIIAKFLLAECAKSSFKRDFILIEDLKFRYDGFCQDKNIDELVKINIVGCQELEQFGARMNSSLYIPYISGISSMKVPGLKRLGYTPGLIRIPKETKARKRNIGCCTRFKNKLLYFLFSKEGIFTNFLVVTVHFVLLFSIPFFILIAMVWSLQQISIIDQDIFAITYDLEDIFSPSKYGFWLDNLEGSLFFYILAGL